MMTSLTPVVEHNMKKACMFSLKKEPMSEEKKKVFREKYNVTEKSFYTSFQRYNSRKEKCFSGLKKIKGGKQWLVNIIEKIREEKPLFYKKHVTAIEFCVQEKKKDWKFDYNIYDHAWVTVITEELLYFFFGTEQLISYIIQTNQLSERKEEFLLDIFKETEFNKKEAKRQMDHLFDVCVQTLKTGRID